MPKSTKTQSKTTKTPSKRTTKTPSKNTQSMKTEIANELGISLGPNATARQNGKVGGEITKRLVSQALKNSNKKK
ncbi:MAG: alpha/beta-type small acid-soluble spore protein [Turicibacter sp.]|nr:alpha/beta-type small acid-soluble spore protein [Turicibacter sp.]